MKLKVNVTRDDIKRGIPEDESYCPIARAVRRLGKKKLVLVDADICVLGLHDFKLPRKAAKFIDKFDNGETVKPFSFTMQEYA